MPLHAADGDRLRAGIRELHELETMVVAEKLRWIAALDQAREEGLGRFRDTEGVVADELGLTRGEATRLTRTAGALEQLPQAAEKLAAGELGIGQVEEAARALEALQKVATDPQAGDDPEVIADTIEELDGLLASGQAGVDRTAARRAVDHLVGSRTQVLADRERRAWANRRVWLQRSPDGGWALGGSLDVLGGAHLNAALDALSRPTGVDDPRDPGQRRADALVELARRALAARDLPQVAAQAPHVILVTTPDAQHDAPDAAPSDLDGYGAVSPNLTRQVCCDAEVTRVTVDPDRRPLDAGRTRRDPSSRQRAAVIARDRVCVGCGAPASRCQIHHIRWWRNGGGTNIDNLTLACWNCHHHIHQQGWQVWQDTTGRYRAGPPPDHGAVHRQTA